MTTVKFSHFAFQFETLIASKMGASLFAQHCKSEFNFESFEFHLQILAFKKITNATERILLMNTIYSTFISQDGAKQINLCNSIVKRLHDCMNQVPVSETVFDEAHRAIMLMLGMDVFPRFLHGTLFQQFVSKSSREKLEAIGAIHKSKLPAVQWSSDDVQSKWFTQRHVSIVLHSMMDFYKWRPVIQEKRFSVYMGTKTYLTKEATEKHGNLQMAKARFYVDNCTVRELVQFMWCTPSRVKSIPLIDFVNFDYQNNVNNKDEPFVSLHREQMNVGNFAQFREFICSNTTIINDNAALVLFKTYYAPDIPVAAKCVRGEFFTGMLYEQSGDSVCCTQVQNFALKGWTPSVQDEILFKNWGTSLRKAGQAAIDEYRKTNPLQQEIWHVLIPGLVDDLNVVQSGMDNMQKGIFLNTHMQLQ